MKAIHFEQDSNWRVVVGALLRAHLHEVLQPSDDLDPSVAAQIAIGIGADIAIIGDCEQAEDIARALQGKVPRIVSFADEALANTDDDLTKDQFTPMRLLALIKKGADWRDW